MFPGFFFWGGGHLGEGTSGVGGQRPRKGPQTPEIKYNPHFEIQEADILHPHPNALGSPCLEVSVILLVLK